MNARSRAAHTRSLGGAALLAAYRMGVSGAANIPTQGPVVVVASGIGPLVGPVIGTKLDRPVHIFGMPAQLGGLAAASPQGSRDARSLLNQGAAVGIQVNNHRDLALTAFLALWSGASVVPVTVQGAHGHFETDPPRLRSTVTMVVFPPILLPASGDPCAWPVVRDAAEQVRQALADAERTVRRQPDQMGTS